MKRISEKKLEAFSVGIMGKRQLSKREIEEQKKKEDEEAAAHAFQEFVETFQQTPNPSSKVWIKAGTYDAGSRREDYRDKGKIYKPSSKIDDKSSTDKAEEYAKMLALDLKKDSGPLKKKNQEKKKSNLELFKEELRQIQEEREERHKYKSMMASSSSSSSQATSSSSSHNVSQSNNSRTTEGRSEGSSTHGGSFDTGDPNTTNLYLGNLSPKITEQQLMEIFGRYGPLASIKIMWPRSEEEKMRGRNCGFVAYMSRKDAERALRTLNGRYVMSYEMRLGWGKAVPIMNQPIFIPPPMLELTMPPPPSGLPFNAQPPPSEAANVPKKHYKEYTTQEEKDIMKRILKKSVVKVIIPTEKSVLHIIHRTIEFVIREGPLFEAMIMAREVDNPIFSFLFDNESPAHIYYRWKLFSLLQGDTPIEWSEKEFRMFKDGPIWKPPIANFYTQGMPDELVVDPEAPEIHKGALSVAQRDRLEDIIHYLTPERSRIGDAMIFCIEHADAADEICECIAESLANSSTIASRKIARLYLISDVLHNCTVKVSNASFFRKSVEGHLVEIFTNLHNFYNAIESRLKAEGFKTRVLNVLRAWNEWAIYSKDFLSQLRLIFLGKQNSPPPSVSSASLLPPLLPAASAVSTASVVSGEENRDEPEEDIDGAPLSGDEKDDEDLDGVPLDGAALLKGVLMRALPEKNQQPKSSQKLSAPTTIGKKHGKEILLKINPNCSTSVVEDYSDDIDGVPLDEDIDGVPIGKLSDQLDNTNKNKTILGATTSNNSSRTFIPSKWETVDPEQIEAQAVTTSKWDTLDALPTIAVSENTRKAKSVKVPNTKSLLTEETKSLKYYDNSSAEDDHEDDADYEDDYEQKLNVQPRDNKNDFCKSTDDDQSDEDNYIYNKAKRKQIKKEIELKVLEYHEELESGQQPLRSGWTVPEQLEYYRKRLLKQRLLDHKKSTRSPPNYKRLSKERSNRNDENESPRHSSEYFCGSSTHYISPSPARTYSSSSQSSSSRRESRSPSMTITASSGIIGDRVRYPIPTSQRLSPKESNLGGENLKYGKRRRSQSNSQSPNDHHAFYNNATVSNLNSPHYIPQGLSSTSSSSSSLKNYGRYQNYSHHDEKLRNKHKY